MDQFPGNSQKARVANEPKKIAPVTSASTTGRKNRRLGKRFKEVLFVGGDARSTADHVAFEVVLPAVRDMMYNAFDDFVHRMVYGDHQRARRGGAPSGYAPTVNYPTTPYHNMGRGQATKAPQPRTLSSSSRVRGMVRELVIASRQDAEEVLEQMYEILSQYEEVSVADLYALVDIRAEHTDTKWGWFDLRGARTERTRQGGYILNLPDPQPLG